MVQVTAVLLHLGFLFNQQLTSEHRLANLPQLSAEHDSLHTRNAWLQGMPSISWSLQVFLTIQLLEAGPQLQLPIYNEL